MIMCISYTFPIYSSSEVVVVFFLSTSHDMQDLSSLTRD